MNIYFDTEFTGLHKNTTLISIGLVAETGETFYAEFTDYDKKQCNEWITENVLKHLLSKKYKRFSVINEKVFVGTKDIILSALKKWLCQFDNVQLISDVCHYDMMLFIDLFGDAFQLPEHISPVCHDINQDIAKYYGISEKEAFDKSREEIVHELSKEPIGGFKHNALYDAKVIKEIATYVM